MWIFGYGSLVWKADFPYIKKIVGYVEGYERKFYQASIDHRGVPEKPGRVVTLIPSDDPNKRVWGVVYKIHKRDVDFVIRHLDLREMMGYEKLPAQFHPVPSHPLNIFEVQTIPEGSSLESSVSSDYSSGGGGGREEGERETDGDSGRGSFLSEETSSLVSESDNESLSSDDEEREAAAESLREGHPFRVTMYFGAVSNEHYIGPASVSKMALQIFECSGFSGSNREYLFRLAEAMREICPEALDAHLEELDTAVRLLELSEQTNENARKAGSSGREEEVCTQKSAQGVRDASASPRAL